MIGARGSPTPTGRRSIDVKQALSEDEIRRYRQEGWTRIEALVTGSALVRLRVIFDGLDEYSGGKIVEGYKDRLVVTRDLWRHYPDLGEMVRNLAPAAALLIGTTEVRLFGDGSYIKPRQADGGASTMWHQDSPGFPTDRRGLLTMWIAVDDISLDQGPVMLLPGSHRLGPLGALDQRGEEIELDALLTEEDRTFIGEPTSGPLKAGDATVHDGYLLHCAGQNRTDRLRRGWAVRFIPATTLYTGAKHRRFDDLGLEPFKPFEHEHFPLIRVG